MSAMSMSSSGGKADIPDTPRRCPLMSVTIANPAFPSAFAKQPTKRPTVPTENPVAGFRGHQRPNLTPGLLPLVNSIPAAPGWRLSSSKPAVAEGL